MSCGNFSPASAATQPEVLHTEENFSVEIGPTKLSDEWIAIDRVSGDAVVITDYKTGRPKSQEDADESLQLSIYALAAREKWGYQVDRLVFHNLEGNTQVSTERGQIRDRRGEAEGGRNRRENCCREVRSQARNALLCGAHTGYCARRPRSGSRILLRWRQFEPRTELRCSSPKNFGDAFASPWFYFLRQAS